MRPTPVKRWLATEDGLRPATQARLLLRWIAIAILVALIAVLYYFLAAAPPRA